LSDAARLLEFLRRAATLCSVEVEWNNGDLDGDWDRCDVDSDDEMSTVSGLWFPAESRGVAAWLQRRWIEHGTRLGVRPWSDVVL
jgi:hypothetical protein